MRSSKFTFKKTTKKVTVHKGVCLDLTEAEARGLLSLAEWRVTYMPDDSLCESLVKYLSEALK